jgi:hypothetical protein
MPLAAHTELVEVLERGAGVLRDADLAQEPGRVYSSRMRSIAWSSSDSSRSRALRARSKAIIAVSLPARASALARAAPPHGSRARSQAWISNSLVRVHLVIRRLFAITIPISGPSPTPLGSP